MQRRYETWSERLTREAIERGEFDNLPGAGRPLPGLTGRDDENWWVKQFLEREKLPMPLPASLALRKEVEDLPLALADVRTEAAAREIIEALNHRIRDSHRRRLDGPLVITRPIDVDGALAEWHARRTP